VVGLARGQHGRKLIFGKKEINIPDFSATCFASFTSSGLNEYIVAINNNYCRD